MWFDINLLFYIVSGGPWILLKNRHHTSRELLIGIEGVLTGVSLSEDVIRCQREDVYVYNIYVRSKE